MTIYQTRPIRFLEVYVHENWKIKIYSISVKNEFISVDLLIQAKENLSEWLRNAKNYGLETYQIATLILHEGKEGNFVIINWWIGENMLQNYVYVSSYDEPSQFALYSHEGIQTCVWELAVIWFERNAWVKHVLMKAPSPDFELYLSENLNEDV